MVFRLDSEDLSIADLASGFLRQHDIVQAARMFPELPDLIPVGGVIPVFRLQSSTEGSLTTED
jgi:hypothetical protein